MKIVFTQIKGDDVRQQMKQQRVDVSQTTSATSERTQQPHISKHFGLQIF